jgi:hypothetical protein
MNKTEELNYIPMLDLSDAQTQAIKELLWDLATLPLAFLRKEFGTELKKIIWLFFRGESIQDLKLEIDLNWGDKKQREKYLEGNVKGSFNIMKDRIFS